LRPSNSNERLATCDFCNEATSFRDGTYFTASEFVTLLRKGLELDLSMLCMATASGISKETLIASLPNEITSAFSTGWLLCPACASKANKILSKQAGNLPEG
jgi:hypothetical protein